MKWKIKDKDYVVETKFAILPKRIGNYLIWFEHYYKTYDYIYQAEYSGFEPTLWIYKEDAEYYVKMKRARENELY